MLDAPKQNWDRYRKLTAKADANWMRSLTLDQRLGIYQDLFNLLWKVQQDRGPNEPLTQVAWQEKLGKRNLPSAAEWWKCLPQETGDSKSSNSMNEPLQGH